MYTHAGGKILHINFGGEFIGGYKPCVNIYNVYDDYATITIIKNSGQKITTKIDIEDIEKCKLLPWIHNTNGYVISSSKTGRYPLHRFVMNMPARKNILQVDHINTDTLDNRKNNLRICTAQENCRNLRNRKIGGEEMIGVRKDKRCINSWRAQIYIDKNKHIEKTYKDKNLAILQRLVWELEYFKEFSPQIDLIKEKYQYLLGYFKVMDHMKFNDNIELIQEIGNSLHRDIHCPCSPVKNENTVCPCAACRKIGQCHCELFVPKSE